MMILVHQKAKIERWLREYVWWEPLLWNETWFFVVSVVIAASVIVLVILLLDEASTVYARL